MNVLGGPGLPIEPSAASVLAPRTLAPDQGTSTFAAGRDLSPGGHCEGVSGAAGPPGLFAITTRTVAARENRT